jgi:hypothetical protein
MGFFPILRYISAQHQSLFVNGVDVWRERCDGMHVTRPKLKLLIDGEANLAEER